jgi:hypothetical protein
MGFGRFRAISVYGRMFGTCTFVAAGGTTSPTESALVFGFGWVVLFQICWMAVILFSPLQQLTRRLVFVVLGVLTLVVLSEISKLNVHQYLKPTKVTDIPEQGMHVN